VQIVKLAIVVVVCLFIIVVLVILRPCLLRRREPEIRTSNINNEESQNHANPISNIVIVSRENEVRVEIIKDKFLNKALKDKIEEEKFSEQQLAPPLSEEAEMKTPTFGDKKQYSFGDDF